MGALGLARGLSTLALNQARLSVVVPGELGSETQGTISHKRRRTRSAGEHVVASYASRALMLTFADNELLLRWPKMFTFVDNLI